MNTPAVPSGRGLHAQGVALLLEKCGFKKSWSAANVKHPDGRQCTVRVQNQIGNIFTLDVDGKSNFMKTLNNDTIIFVNYEKPGVVEVYECLDNQDYKMDYVSGVTFAARNDRNFSRLVLKFNAEKMKLIHSFTDQELWENFRARSNSRVFNIESPHYAKS